MALNKKKIIIVMCVAICFMAFGYAMFGNTLNINGSATVASNWLIEFIEIEEVSKTDGVEILSEPTASGTTATFNVNLKYPGDKITYEITVKNSGTLNAIVNKINASETGSEAFYFNISGIKQGDKLSSGKEKVITIEIGYDASITDNPETPRNRLVMDIEFVQDLNQSINGEDIIIEGPILTTLSGSNSLTLENSAGRKLNNYIIKGNSVQNGTPTPDEPIEIQSVGNKTKNILESYGFSAINIQNPSSNRTLTNSYGTTISTIEFENSLTITQSQTGDTSYDANYSNGYFNMGLNNLEGNYILSFDIDIKENPLNATSILLLSQGGVNADYLEIPDGKSGRVSVELNYIYNKDEAYASRRYLEFRCMGMSFTISNIMLTEVGETTEYEPIGYKIPVQVSGKNLFNDNSIVGQSNVIYNNGTVTQKDEDTSTYIQFKLQAYNNFNYVSNIASEMVTKTGKIYLTFIKDDTFDQINFGLNGQSIDTTLRLNASTLENGKTYTLSVNMLDITQGKVSWNNIQMEEGDVATNYEPYVEPKTYDIYLDEPLRKVGDYVDYIDFSKQNIFRNTEKLILDGSEYWYSTLENGKRRVFLNSRSSVTQNIVLSDKYVKDLVNAAYPDINKIMVNSAGSVIIGVDNNVFQDLETYKTWLKTNNVTIYLPLERPVEETIKLPKIGTNEWTSIVSIINDNGVDVPIEINYYKMK